MTEALFQVDEAIQVLDKYDHEKLRDARKSAENNNFEHMEFCGSFSAKAKAVRGAIKGKKSAPKFKKKVLPHHVDQKTAAACMPPGASLWRDLKRGGWCSHLPPRKRISESFAKHGEQQLHMEQVRAIVVYWRVDL